MKNNNFALVALGVLGVAGAPGAAANENGFYIGGYVGQASKRPALTAYQALTAGIQEFDAFQPVEERTSFDDKDTTFALIGGYRFNRYLAVEGSYARFGRVAYHSHATGNFPLEPGSLVTTVESETRGFSLSILGVLPLTRDWELFARGGAVFADNTFSFDVTSQSQVFVPPTGRHAADSLSKGSTETFAGIGISRRILEIYDLRLEYQRVFDAGVEFTGGPADIDAALLGLTVTF
ncbi:MAG TPA: outer membrane beta-barrel protein [Steroidobacteraceae bacterium]|nr:outer membrane beta-barrel protein [Steroidobacteraceae bacterium]